VISFIKFSVLASAIFLIGIASQNWKPETSCIKAVDKIHCKTEQVDFWKTSAEEFIHFGDGQGDVTHYLEIARYLSEGPDLSTGEKSPQLMWSLSNWPPGVPFIIYLVTTLFGGDHYFVKMLAAISVVLAGVFLTLSKLLPRCISARIYSPFLFLFLFSLPDFRYQTLTFGYIVSEGWAIASFLLSLTFLFKALSTFMRKDALLAGITLAVSCYIRALLDTLISITLLLLVLIGFFWLAIFWKRHSRFPRPEEFSRRFLLTSLTIFLTCSACVAPWKLRNKKVTNRYSMCATSDSVFDLHWELSEKMPGWIATTNVPCRLQPELCRQLHEIPAEKWRYLRKSLTKAFLLLNLPDWLKFRARDFYLFWTNYPYRPTSFPDWKWVGAWLEGLIYLVAGAIWLISLLRKPLLGKYRAENGFFDAYLLVFMMVNGLVFLVAPYEHRYSIFLRLTFLVAGLTRLSCSLSNQDFSKGRVS